MRDDGRVPLPETKRDASTAVPDDSKASTPASELRACDVLSVDLTDPASRARVRRVVESLGETKLSAARSRLLDQRIRSLVLAESGNSRITDNLDALATKVRRLDPAHLGTRRPGLLARMFGQSPDGGTERLVAARAEIDAIVDSLVRSAEALRQGDVALEHFERDILAESRQVMADIELADDFEQSLLSALERAKADGLPPATIRFIESDLLYSLEQRRHYLQGLLAVNQQAAISLAILKDTNTTLVENILRITQATVHALDLAVTLQLSLVEQRAARVYARMGRRRSPASGAVTQDAAADLADLEMSFDRLFRVLEENDLWRRTLVSKTERSLADLQDLSQKMLEDLGDAG